MRNQEASNENDKRTQKEPGSDEQVPYEPPTVQSVKLTDEAAESLT